MNRSIENKVFLNREISIVTIVLNQKDLIEQTIKSVLEQKDINIEYIVIDGGSTDGTLEIIESYRDRLTHFVSEPDGGIYQAINKGISFASKPLVGLIHCGDFYEKDVLKNVCDEFEMTKADVIYGNIEIIEEVGNVVVSHFPIANHKLLNKKMSIFHPSSFISLNTYKKFGLYDTSYRSAADYEFLLRLFVNECHFSHYPAILAIFRAEGLSGKNFQLSLKENVRIRSKHINKWNGFKYLLVKSGIHFVFSIRKKTIKFLIGENNFNKIKQFKYNK
jgi:glycosyltransferase involved in cell wall biosynthesis